MNFLEMVNNLILESAVTGSTVSTVQGKLPLEIARLKMWTIDSWNEIQAKPAYWGFHFVQASMTVPLNASVLQPPEFAAGQVAEWETDSFRIADAGQGRKDSQHLRYMDYFRWRDNAGLDLTVSRRPESITIDYATESLMLAPPSDAIRTLYYDYWRTPQELVADTDVPIMPKRFHKLIVGKALEKYGIHEAAPEAQMQARKIINELQNALHQDQGTGIETVGLIYY